jgi:hypothetical protein
VDKKKCDKIVKFFEQFHERPVLFTGKSSDFTRTIQFVTGFHEALKVIGEIVPSHDAIRSAYSRRGWSGEYFGAADEMKGKGLDGDEITREIISVEIEIWSDLSGQLT